MHVEQLDDLTVSLADGYVTLRDAAAALSDAGINIEAVCMIGGGAAAECHVLVKSAIRATAALEQRGIVVLDARRVYAMRLPNRPGTLARVLDLLLPQPGAIDFIYQATDRGLIVGSPDADQILRTLSPFDADAMAVSS